MERFLKGRVEKLAKKVDKEDFLEQLKEQWRPLIRKDSNIEVELKKAMERIKSPGPFSKAFEIVGITKDDIKRILKQLQEGK